MTTEIKRKTDEELAAELGLRIARSVGWGKREIQTPDGKALASCGVDAVRAWLCGYAVATERAVAVVEEARRIAAACEERMRAVCRPTDPQLGEMAFSVQVLERQVERIRTMDAPPSCPNPACKGGFVGGDDPHACGEC
jgi:hypothetical protein